MASCLATTQGAPAGRAAQREQGPDVRFGDGFGRKDDVVEDKIANIEDGRRLAKYARMSRYDYAAIVGRLVDDKLLRKAAQRPFEEMQEAFNQYRTQVWVVPGDEWRKFQDNLNAFRGVANQ